MKIEFFKKDTGELIDGTDGVYFVMSKDRMMEKEKPIPYTEDDLNACWPHYQEYYLLQILNGDYSLAEARDDLNSLIGSRFDQRNKASNLLETTKGETKWLNILLRTDES